MKILFFLIATVLISSCNESNNDCLLEKFDSFEMEKLDTSQYRFLNENLVSKLEQCISYKFKDKTIVSFVKGKDFTLLSFSLKVNKPNAMNSIRVRKGETKTQIRKSYLFCGYLGRKLAFRPKNNRRVKHPILNLDTDKIKKKIIKSNFIFVDGNIKNLGLYLEDQEYIFMPYDNAFYTQKEDLYVKVLLINDGNTWMIYIFYAKDKFKTKVLDGLRLN